MLKKILLIIIAVFATHRNTFASPRTDLRWVYEKTFGKDTEFMADINVELLKRCAYKRDDLTHKRDEETCTQGTEMFNHTMKLFNEKVVTQVNTINRNDTFGTFVYKVKESLQSEFFLWTNVKKQEDFRYRIIYSD